MHLRGALRSFALLFVAVLCAHALAPTVAAQGPPGGGFFNHEEMGQRLDGLDANKNGLLEPNEVEGRARYMVEGMARGAGLDTSKPIPLDKLKEAMRQRMQRGPGGPPSGDSRDNNSST